jgi:hypothetical protein
MKHQDDRAAPTKKLGQASGLTLGQKQEGTRLGQHQGER